MKKITLLCHSYPPVVGGGETHIYTISKLLADRGYEVSVVTGVITNSSDYKKRPVHKGVTIYEIPNFREFSWGLAGFRDIALSLYCVLQKIKPDIVHVHNFGPLLALSYVSSRLNFKICFTYHSTPVPKEGKIIGYFPNYELEKTFAHFIFSSLKYDVLICPSKYYRDWALKLGAKSSKTKIIYHGVDNSIFNTNHDRRYRKSLGFKDDDFVVCSPVRLIERKGILDLISALKYTKSPIKLLVPTSLKVAKPQFKNKVDILVKKLGVGNKIVFLFDEISYIQMPKIYSASDLVVLPSHVEGLGLVLLEAMACGKPVIGTNTSGIKEVIQNKQNGLLVEVKNIKQIAKAINKIYSDRILRSHLVHKGLESTRIRFSATRQVEELIKIYEDL